VLDEQDALPEQVDVAAVAVRFLDRRLERGDPPLVMPNTLKKASQKLLASASSDDSSAHSFENVRAFVLISFQLSGITPRHGTTSTTT